MFKNISRKERQIVIIVSILALIGAGSGGYFSYSAARDIVKNTEELEGTILDLQNENLILNNELKKEQGKNKTFQSQIGEIAGTIGTLDKLSKTDKELLEKYSKIYFLNEHYVPSSLTNIPPDYLYVKTKETKIHSQVYPFLQEMLTDAKKAGLDLEIISAYRSFGEQSSLKSGYTVIYGTGSNRFSADQGYSEHQLGTTLDFTTKKVGATFSGFEKTDEFKWLQENAYKYGFVLSYPKGNSYYQYEPWHWRFVGKNLAKRLYEDKQYFYDLDQATINMYLISIFD